MKYSKSVIAFAAVVALPTTTVAQQRLPDLTVKVQQAAPTGSGSATKLLLIVANPTAVEYETTRWSCVIYANGAPVSEDQHYIERVIAKGDTVKETIQSYKGPIDDVRCRLLSAR
jgi:hypothetical protein